jgi:AcrR family transcriptional regulator
MNEQSVNTPLSKGSKTKEKILKHALKLFSSKGFKATTVRDIAGSIGIKQSALYNHFKNKDEILETLIQDLTSSAIVTLFDNKDASELHKEGKTLLMGLATPFKLLSFDAQNEALFKLLMQELFRNERIREIYNEYFYQENVKKL